jgi:hypothetical protein
MTTYFFHPSLLLLFLDPGSEMGKPQDSGPGINIPDPQHWNKPERVHLELEEVNIRRVGHGVRTPALLALPPVRVCGCLAQ